MDLGKKLRQARLELGLSQLQVCQGVITRNMISMIENGAAAPSMDTLQLLAARLQKPVSYFLDEQAVTSPNQDLMEQARTAFDGQDHEKVLSLMDRYQAPDPLFDREAALMEVLALLALAEQALAVKKYPYARELLERAKGTGERTPYYTRELERRRLLTLAQIDPVELPEDDRELLIRAQRALEAGQGHEAARYLDAAQDREVPGWNFLRGRAYLLVRDYAGARRCFEKAWDHDPRACAMYLEQCCYEQEDFKGAYHYACRIRELAEEIRYEIQQP